MRHIKSAPDAPGVFAFFVGRKLVFFGIAELSLREHLQGQLVSQSAVASEETVTGFVYEVLSSANEAEDRFRELLFEFNTMNGHMPERNGRRNGSAHRGGRPGDAPRTANAATAAAGTRRPRWGDHP